LDVHVSQAPLAMQRAPSRPVPGPNGSKPYNYPRLVQPVLDAKCVSCHGKDRKAGMPDLRRGDYLKDRHHFYTSFYSLVPKVHYYSRAYRGDWGAIPVQRDAFVGPYTKPGAFGANASPLYAMLNKGHNGVKLTEEEMQRLVLFMESNASYFGHDNDIEAQAGGQVVLPVLQ
jgi:hypothetical protein